MIKTKVLILLIISAVFLFNINCKTISRLTDKSGNRFVVEIQTDEPNRREIVEQAINVVKHRINALGVDGEVIKNPDNENQIGVKIYGSHDWTKLKKFLFTTYRLQLKKVVTPPNPAPLKTSSTKFDAQEFVKEGEEYLPYVGRGNSGFVIVEKNDIINGEDIRSAEAVTRTDSPNDYQISFTLKPGGAKKFGAWTERNINNYLAVVLDDEVQSVAFIKSKISDAGQINGSFDKETAENIALALKSGYLPAAMKPIEEKPFGEEK